MHGIIKIQDDTEIYKKTKFKLKEMLEEARSCLDLIQSIKEPNARLSYQDFLDIQEKIKKSISVASSEEIVALMLEEKSLRRLEKQRVYKPLILTTSPKFQQEKSDAELFAEKLSKNNTKDERYNLILLGESGHATPMIIDFSGDKPVTIFTDAAGDISNQETAKKMNEILNAESYSNLRVGTQKDNSSCSFFSIQELTQLSKLPIETLKDSFRDSDKILPYINPHFIKNSQSQSLIEQYKQSYKQEHGEEDILLNKSKLLDEYLDEFSVKIDFKDEQGKNIYCEKNYSIIFKRLQRLSGALDLLNTLTPLALSDLVYKCTAQDVIIDMKIANEHQLKLIKDYKVNMYPMQYQCFEDNQLAEKSFAFITNGIDINSISENERILMQDRFSKVARATELEELESMIQESNARIAWAKLYEIPLEDLIKSKCFYTDEGKEIIQLAYDIGGKDKVKEIFEKIKYTRWFQVIPDNVDYKIPKLELHVASKDWDFYTREALNYIQSAAQENPEKAREVFSKLAELKNSVQFELVMKYDIDPVIVKSSKISYSEASQYILKQMELFSAQEAKQLFYNLKDLTNNEQVDCVMKYQLDVEAVRDARCFQKNRMFGADSIIKEAKNLIEEAYRNNGTYGAQKAFKAIRNLGNIHELEAYNAGLDPDEIAGSKCFSRNNGALELILKCRAEKGEEEALSLFRSIKDFDDQIEFDAILKYKIPSENLSSWEYYYKNSIVFTVLDKIKEKYNYNTEETINAFNKIKNIRGSDRMLAVLEFELDPEEVRKSSCFDNTNNGVLELLKSDPANAKQIFNAIKSESDPSLFSGRIKNSKFLYTPLEKIESKANEANEVDPESIRINFDEQKINTQHHSSKTQNQGVEYNHTADLIANELCSYNYHKVYDMLSNSSQKINIILPFVWRQLENGRYPEEKIKRAKYDLIEIGMLANNPRMLDKNRHKSYEEEKNKIINKMIEDITQGKSR